jgi:cation transport ATPase
VLLQTIQNMSHFVTFFVTMQAQRPQLTRWLDRVGEVWSKAVIGATLATAALLPLLGVPFLGDRGALYRAMGVLTAGVVVCTVCVMVLLVARDAAVVADT